MQFLTHLYVHVNIYEPGTSGVYIEALLLAELAGI